MTDLPKNITIVICVFIVAFALTTMVVKTLDKMDGWVDKGIESSHTVIER